MFILLSTYRNIPKIWIPLVRQSEDFNLVEWKWEGELDYAEDIDWADQYLNEGLYFFTY